jgi:dephospho-CoA kinase
MWRKKTKPLQIGITGGIGSGKSLVCRIFNVLGIPVYEADSRAKLLYIQNAELKKQIIHAFGVQAYTANGQLNKTYLAGKVFTDSDQLMLLNSLVHPKVAEDYSLWVQQHIHFPYIIKEAALLFESGSYAMLDKVITVFTPVELRLRRISQRDKHRTEEEIKTIISKQMAEEEKLAKADFVVHNDEAHLLIPQILHLHQQFLSKVK